MVTNWPSAIAAGWHPVALSNAVRSDRTLPVMLMGRPLIVMRDDEGVFALADRCPHRGVPLSRGRAADGVVACAYHGWRFGRDGVCLEVPGSTSGGARARSYECVERVGLVWVALALMPAEFPRLPQTMCDTTLDRFWWPLESSRADVLDALENHLDPAHPHHVHPWMVRSAARRKDVSVRVRSGSWGAEAIYREEGGAAGLIPTLMEGHRTTSIGRLYPPTTGEVSFEGPQGLRLSVSVIFQPVADGVTRPWAHFATPRGLVPAGLKALVLKLIHLPILRQDRRILAIQRDARRDDEAVYAEGPLDLLGPTIWRLANGKIEPERTYETILRL